jgi:hypothetical protein
MSIRQSLLALPLAAVIAMLAVVALDSRTASADDFCIDFKGELCFSLTPDTDTNPVGSDHTVTANITGNAEPLEGLPIAFFVTAGPNIGESASGDTDAAGNIPFTYTGAGGVGTDEIIAVGCVTTEICDEIVSCLEENVSCLEDIEIACFDDTDTQSRLAAGTDKKGFGPCFGPLVVEKVWQDPTPSPTPVDVGAGGQTPAPSPAELPASGGSTGGGSTPWMMIALVGAAVATSATALAIAGSRAARR